MQQGDASDWRGKSKGEEVAGQGAAVEVGANHVTGALRAQAATSSVHVGDRRGAGQAGASQWCAGRREANGRVLDVRGSVELADARSSE